MSSWQIFVEAIEALFFSVAIQSKRTSGIHDFYERVT